ncbi:acetyl-CoA carboxylase biotin carboxylase subunit [Secundilactobacillus yichangensis]|uniref:acetyl-CoA carboxylase biotin carboxylase subunit n=1 Tax=Secundilactobacillus yichangensis TaxID=2799580 RepID=UPI00194135B7|nr:acetyl-CoA carboxylase biotin carboxylase subunit [Secundilactobacillus yichangensis]
MEKVLVANRGEIAVRIIRACQELGLSTVAVYSTADKDALHVKLADEAVCIGAASPTKSYLNINNLLGAAQITGADAVHPGYGFLSENAEFAERCLKAGLTFIGPKPETISLLGDKERARETLKAVGVPVTPGSDGKITTVAEAQADAKKIGYPVMVKAVAGGGGKGMRLISTPDQLEELFTLAQNEAVQAFGSNEMYLEKFIDRPRHIEVQVLGFKDGTGVAVGERDCSLQIHHQKVVEEAPSSIDPATRDKMLAVSKRAVEELHYLGAGTLEFLYAGPDQFYFMEMNTRIQVEHPITELTSGWDLVKAQLLIADGKVPSAALAANGYAVECRINASSAGQIIGLHLPGGNGIRVDTALYQGYKVPPNYDSMIAKIISYGPDRQTAVQKMLVALNETVITGIETNLDFLNRLLRTNQFQQNQFDIEFIERELLPQSDSR